MYNVFACLVEHNYQDPHKIDTVLSVHNLNRALTINMLQRLEYVSTDRFNAWLTLLRACEFLTTTLQSFRHA